MFGRGNGNRKNHKDKDHKNVPNRDGHVNQNHNFGGSDVFRAKFFENMTLENRVQEMRNEIHKMRKENEDLGMVSQKCR